MHASKKLVKICKYMHIETETTKSLFNDSYRYLKLHIIEGNKNMLFHTLHKTSNYVIFTAIFVSRLNCNN
jgi:hypothetical protein